MGEQEMASITNSPTESIFLFSNLFSINDEFKFLGWTANGPTFDRSTLWEKNKWFCSCYKGAPKGILGGAPGSLLKGGGVAASVAEGNKKKKKNKAFCRREEKENNNKQKRQQQISFVIICSASFVFLYENCNSSPFYPPYPPLRGKPHNKTFSLFVIVRRGRLGVVRFYSPVQNGRRKKNVGGNPAPLTVTQLHKLANDGGTRGLPPVRRKEREMHHILRPRVSYFYINGSTAAAVKIAESLPVGHFPEFDINSIRRWLSNEEWSSILPLSCQSLSLHHGWGVGGWRCAPPGGGTVCSCLLAFQLEGTHSF